MMEIHTYRRLLSHCDLYLDVNHYFTKGWCDGILFSALHDPDIDSEDYASLEAYAEEKTHVLKRKGVSV